MDQEFIPLYCRVVFHGMEAPQLLTYEGHLSCFQFGAITNKAAMNFYVQVFSEPKFSFLWDVYAKEYSCCVIWHHIVF